MSYSHKSCGSHNFSCSDPCFQFRPQPPRRPSVGQRVLQVSTVLTSATQDPNIFDWAAASGGTGADGFVGPTGGLTVEVNSQISNNGSLIYEIFEALPALNILPAQLYSNNNGVKTLLQSIAADPSFSGTDFGTIDSGGASPDFSLFSLIDDDGAGGGTGPITLRVRVFAASDFTTPVTAVTFTDFAGGGSANGGFFTADNKYLFVNYISGTTGVGPVFKVLSVQSGLSTVATAPTPGFAAPTRPITVRSKTYIPSTYLSSTDFTNPNPGPPFGFQLFIFDERDNSLLVKNSPTMYESPVIDATLLSNGKIRIAAGLRNIASIAGITGVGPYPAIPLSHLNPDTMFTDSNNIQIFDFDPETKSLVPVYHTTISGGVAVVNWLPSSNGTILAVVHTLAARLNSTDFDVNLATDASDWLVLETDANGSISSREVGPLQVLPPAVLYGQISKNSQWLIYGATVTTPYGFFLIPSLGQNTMDTAGPNPSGFNDALLYQIQPPLTT